MPQEVQIYSDIHLEFGVTPLLEKRADILILAGDICTTRCLERLVPMMISMNHLNEDLRPVIEFGRNEELHQFYQ